MATSEFENARWTRIISAYLEKKRPEKQIRHQLDYGFKIKGQSIELYSIVPRFNQPNEKIECGFAKATYVRTENIWKVYWQRADLKWHKYGPKPVVKTIEAWLSLIDKDEFGCFYG